MPKFSGLFATPVTAYDSRGNVDPSGIHRVVNFIAANGVKNMFCLGSWGGFALMNTAERLTAAQAYLEAGKNNGMSVIINVAATTPKEAILLAQHAYENGADAVASLVPFYYSSSGYSQANILNYFEKVIKSVPIPVHFYNNPRTTGYTLGADMLRSLLDVGVTGMKEGGGNIATFVEMMEILNDRGVDFDMIPGSVTMFPIGLLYGVQATMIGSAVVFPELACQAWQSWTQGAIHEATCLHAKLMKIRRIQSSRGMGSASCYALLRLRGIDIGSPPQPWIDLSDSDARHLQVLLREMNLPI